MKRTIKLLWSAIIIFSLIFFVLYKIIFMTFCNFYSFKNSLNEINIERVNECRNSYICEVKNISYNKKFEIIDWQCWKKIFNISNIINITINNNGEN